MLEKKKINIDVSGPLSETQTIEDKNGNSVNILKMIPYAEKEEMALELAALTLSADEETGVCYENALFDLALTYLFVKYYTDIDVSDIQDVDGYQRLYDYCAVSGLDYFAFCKEDYMRLMEYWENYSAAIIRMYEARHSLGYAVKRMIDTNVDPNNQETRELIEKLISMRQAYEEKQASPVQLGGNVLNFAKKEN